MIGKDVQIGVKFPTGEPITYPFGICNFYVADPELKQNYVC